MHKISFPIAALVAAISLVGCGKDTTAETNQAAVSPNTDAEKQAYSLGVQMGEFVKQRVEEHKRLQLPLNEDMVAAGFEAALNNNALYGEEEVKAQLQALETSFRNAQQAEQDAASQENLAVGQEFLAENAGRDGVTVTESGLQYEVLTQGDGPKPTAEDTVKVHYQGTLLDGTEFDSSYKRGEPAVFPLRRVIAGWTEGVQLMNVGSKYKFFIPANLAYGERATGNIQPNSTLIFEVELLSIETKPVS